MKKFGGTFLCILTLLCLSGCSNVFQKQGEKASDLEYGSITIVQKKDGTDSRALDVSEITSATVTVSGYGMTDVKKENVTISEGTGSCTIDNIPTGSNRVVTVKSNIDGAVIRGVCNVVPGDFNQCEVNWDSTAIASVYYNLIKSGTNISSVESSSFSSKIPEVHASLFKSSEFAAAFKAAGFNASGISSADYVLDYGNIIVNYSNTNGYTVQVTDIASEKTTFTKASGTATLKGFPGECKLKVFDATGTLKETKDVVVASGKDTTINLEYGTGVDFSNRTIIFVKAGSAPNIWAWEEDGAALSDGQGGVWKVSSTATKMVPVTSDYMANPSGWYMIDYTYKADGTTKLATGKTIKFKLNWSDPELTGAAGTFWYDSTSTTSNPSPVIAGLSVTVVNPAVPLPPTVSCNFSDGDEIDVNGSVTFTVESENTSLTSGTYTVGSRTGTLAVGTNKIDLPSGLSAGQTITVSAIVENEKGSDSLSISLTTAEIAQPSTPTRLGAFYERCATSFSIWSPDSSNVKVAVKKQGETSFTEYTCTKGFTVDGGYPDSSNIYGVTVMGDCNLAEYQFYVGGKAVRDPYGKMVKYDGNHQKSNKIADGTENGFSYTSYAGSSINIVMDMDSTDPVGGWAARPVLENRCDAIVYEVHVADFTSDSTWNGTEANRGKFPGMVETGTTYSTVKTGIDHLKELGITHVQILPMYDFATKYNNTLNDIYNWGYDPVNYNVPEDRYSTCPGDYVERVREVKTMINEFHKNGIRVIMDVVYNHTFSKEMFNSISSQYYTSTDLSGCGNSINTGVSMVSRMIRDSLEYWAEEYNIDGFRFDLLGIYHTSAVKNWGEYLNNENEETKNVKLLMYGEPWNGYANDSEESAKVRMSAVSSLGNAHVGVFNGKYRQSLKGANDKAARGYIFNKNEDDGTAYAANIAVGLKGSGTSLDKTGCSDTSGSWTRFFTSSPSQSINYMFAHDNLCYWDKINTAGVTDNDYKKRIVKFGHGILLVSQGIPFIHAGDEFLRTKAKGAGSSMSHNSYMAGIETNSIDWSLKAANKSVFQYHADLIALRKAHDGLRNRNGVGTTECVDNAVKYYVQDKNGTKLCIVVNPGNEIDNPVSGTKIFDINGANATSKKCEGTAVTIIQY